MRSLAGICRSLVAGIGLALLLAVPAHAAKTKPIALTPEQVGSVQSISDYINGFKNLQGEFTQISPKGNTSRGVFFISRPGKMRFEYAPPNPFLLVADGRWLTIKNRAKEKGDQFPLSQTPLKLVLGENVDLLRDTDILQFDEADGLVSVMLEPKKSTLGGGQLILIFDLIKMQIQQWVVIDGKGRRTTVSLENIVSGVKPDPKLFVVKINREEKWK